MAPVTSTWASDCALVIAPTESAHPLPTLHLWLRRLQAARVPGVLNLTVGSTSLTVVLDPMHCDPLGVQRAIECALSNEAIETSPTPTRRIDIPVCYDQALAPDLQTVADHVGITINQLVTRHTEPLYTVDFLGFAPGFGYLSGLPEQLHTPRFATPRTRVPAGSVGIGGAHTGIYPFAMPGGWQIIGRTLMRMFDTDDEPPTVLQPSDHVRFVPISLSAFEQAAQERTP